MVTVFLRGGLGNQMFQYALGLNLAQKNNADLRIDTTFLNDRTPRKEFTYRKYDMDVFELAPHFTALSKWSDAFPIPGAWLALDLASMKIRSALHSQTIVREKTDLVFDPDVLNARGDLLLYGRWQTDKYFLEIADAVRDAFQFKYGFEGEAVLMANAIAGSDSVSLHVRRGDYVNFQSMKNLMGDTDTDYYRRAVAAIAQNLPHPRLFIFSDDIAWCREHLKFDFATTYLDDSTRGPKASWHMHLMSLCKHNIITNSTFSWWGAWLNQNPGKTVIAPKRWQAGIGSPSPLETASKGLDEENSDVVPAGWIRI